MLEAMPARHGLLPASRLRGTEETPQPAHSKPPRPKANLSGQPGGRGVSTPPGEPEAMNGGLCERQRPGALLHLKQFQLQKRWLLGINLLQKYGEVFPADWEEGKEALKPDFEGVANYLAKH